MPSTAHRVAVIGGGVAGITTAILLQANDYRTFLYSKAHPSHEPDVAREPEFATLHAAASVLPHSVNSPSVERWTRISQHFFRALSFRASCGIRSQTHYEIFESIAVPDPPYASAVENYEMLTGPALADPWVPRRPGATDIAGWKFDSFFCEVPEYVRYLYALYEAIGGRIMPASALPGPDLYSYLGLNYTFYVNCTGSGAQTFVADAAMQDRETWRVQDDPDPSRAAGLPFEELIDGADPRLVRGHYLRVDIKEIMTGERGRFFSYNYKPTPEIYQTAEGLPADVYCYPRSDAWILGGSRQVGVLEDDAWVWEDTVGPTSTFPCDEIRGGIDVPAPVFELNADLLLEITRGKLDLRRLLKADPSVVSAGVGYRFMRAAPYDSIRVDASRVLVDNLGRSRRATKYVFHNYGHGGSGFTLSWGCAFELLRMLDIITGHAPRRQVQPQRRKFVVTHAATRLLLLDLTARLLADMEPSASV